MPGRITYCLSANLPLPRADSTGPGGVLLLLCADSRLGAFPRNTLKKLIRK
jgi:hypothetical protein